jgi:pyruvate kinase
MIAFARETGVDFVGISFVESAAHVEAIRGLVGGMTPQILAKVENRGGLEHLDEVVGAADAIMIDRGDLSVETTMELVAVHQKTIVRSARAAGKPVVVATEMLHSMIENDFPTKAEVSDITNAVIDGCSATMLSGETAVGRFPIEAVRTMRRVADGASEHALAVRAAEHATGTLTAPRAMAQAIAMLLEQLPVTKVVAITRSGYAARVLSSLSVSQPILAVSDQSAMARSFNLIAGVEGVHFDAPFPQGSADHVKACVKQLYQLGKLEAADEILVTGVIYPSTGTRMNLLQIHRVSDLIEVLGW